MKKISLYLIAILLIAVFTFASCTSAKAQEAEDTKAVEETTAEDTKAVEETTAESVEKKDWNIAVVVKDATNAWYINMDRGVKRFADDTGLNAYMKGPSTVDAALQVQVIQDLIYQDVDAICLIPTDIPSVEPILGEAIEQGIVVIVQEGSYIKNKHWGLEAFNNDDYGAVIMDSLAEAMGNEGLYTTMVAFVTNASHNQWADAGVARQKEAYPDMQLLEEEPRVETESNVEKSYEKAKELFKKYPDLKGIFGTTSKDAPGTARAIEELGLVGQKFACGSGMPNESRQYIERGTLQAVTLWDSSEAGYTLCELARKVLDDELVGEGIDLGIKGYENLKLQEGTTDVLLGNAMIVLTKDNIGNYDF